MRDQARRSAALLSLVLLLPVRLPAQTLHTQIHDSASGAPLGGALVQLVAADGRLAAVGTSSPSGRVNLGPVVPGRYRVRVLRIGFRPWISEQIELAGDGDRERVLQATAVPVELAEITVTTESPCEASPEADRRMALLWDEARTVLGLAQAGAPNLVFQSVTFRRELGADRQLLREDRLTAVGRGAWPILTQSPDSLALLGYVQPRDTISGPVYFGPDPVVFFSDAFLGGHCFRLVPAPADAPDLLGLGFEPLPDRRLPDVTGVLWFRRHTGLLRLEYRYTGLWRWVPRDGAGGTMDFARLPGGRPIVTGWTILAPIAERYRGRVARPSDGDTRRFFGGGAIELHGFREEEGRVDRVRTRSGRELWRRATDPDGDSATSVPSKRAS